MRVFTATLGAETDTSSPIPTGWRAFADTMLWRPGNHPDQPTEATGALWACRRRAREQGWSVVEGTCAYAMPGGPIPQPVYEALRDEILGQLRAALPLDMVALGLHGATVADGNDDCEGDLLEQVRAVVGPEVPVGAELDCHAHLTPRMLAAADLLVFFKEYPHTDYVERGEQLLALLERTRLGQIRPVMRAAHTHLLVAFPTRVEPTKSLVAAMREAEHGGVLSVSLVHGYPRGDVADVGAQVLVVTDGDAALAERTARSFAERVFAMREQLRSVREAPEATLAAAVAAQRERGGPVILVDADDNPGGGAAGDNTWVIRLLQQQGLREACVGPLWDPLAVRFCFDASVGATLALRIGGKVGPESGAPLDVHAEVLALRENHHQPIDRFDAPLGDAAAIRFDGIEVVLTSVRDQAYDPALFSGLGIDPAARRFVVVKSAQQYRIGFDRLGAPSFVLRRPRDAAARPRKAIRALWPIDDLQALPGAASP